jgi:broad specificity phosphatase PhoE
MVKKRLILVRHSVPAIRPSVPASQWHLSKEGRERCKDLATRLAPYQPDLFVASVEPKAVETAQITADILGTPWKTAENLHEHDRTSVPFGTRDQFEADVAAFFAKPGQLVFGRETADGAFERFSAAVASVIEQHPVPSLVVVAHGTVMTLYLARTLGLPAFDFWRRLGLPAFVVLSHQDHTLEAIVEQV